MSAKLSFLCSTVILFPNGFPSSSPIIVDDSEIRKNMKALKWVGRTTRGNKAELNTKCNSGEYQHFYTDNKFLFFSRGQVVNTVSKLPRSNGSFAWLSKATANCGNTVHLLSYGRRQQTALLASWGITSQLKMLSFSRLHSIAPQKWSSCVKAANTTDSAMILEISISLTLNYYFLFAVFLCRPSNPKYQVRKEKNTIEQMAPDALGTFCHCDPTLIELMLYW